MSNISKSLIGGRMNHSNTGLSAGSCITVIFMALKSPTVVMPSMYDCSRGETGLNTADP